MDPWYRLALFWEQQLRHTSKQSPGTLGVSMKNRVFTTGEVAAICGVSADTVSRWFDLGQIDGYRLGPGGDRRIPSQSLRKFMLSHGIPLERLEEGEWRVLVVDDDPYYLDIIPSVLSRDGEYIVLTASTGFDAGAMVVEHNPQLVILDIHLSDMDGRMVCERIKSRAETRNTRILASPASSRKRKFESWSYGFDDFLKKPFRIEELSARVARLFEMPNSRLCAQAHRRLKTTPTLSSFFGARSGNSPAKPARPRLPDSDSGNSASSGGHPQTPAFKIRTTTRTQPLAILPAQAIAGYKASASSSQSAGPSSIASPSIARHNALSERLKSVKLDASRRERRLGDFAQSSTSPPPQTELSPA